MTSLIFCGKCKSSCKSKAAGKFLQAHAKHNALPLNNDNRKNNKSMLSLSSKSLLSLSLSLSIDNSNWFDQQQKQAKRFWPSRQLTRFQWLQQRFMSVALIVYIIATLLPYPVIDAAAINTEVLNNYQLESNYTEDIFEESTEMSNDLPMMTTTINSMTEEPTFVTTEVVTVLPNEQINFQSESTDNLLESDLVTTILPEIMPVENETEVMSTTLKIFEEKFEINENQTSNVVEDSQKIVEKVEDKESVLTEVNNDILDNNFEENSVKNKISAGAENLDDGSDPAESLEESIRNSVKTEIAQEQNLESSPVLEILKEIPEPEIRDILREDMPIESQALEQQQELKILAKEDFKHEEETNQNNKDETILEEQKAHEVVRGSRHLEYQTTILPLEDENEYFQATTYMDIMNMEALNDNFAETYKSPMSDPDDIEDNVDANVMSVDLKETDDITTTLLPLLTSEKLSNNLKDLQNKQTITKEEEEEMSNDVNMLSSMAFDDNEGDSENITPSISTETDENQQHMIIKKILPDVNNNDNVEEVATTIRDVVNSYRSLESTTLWSEIMNSEVNPVTELQQFSLAPKGRSFDFDETDEQNEKMLMDMNDEKSDWIKSEEASSEIKLETVLGMNDEGMETMVTTYTPSIVFRTGEDEDNDDELMDNMMTTTTETLFSSTYPNKENENLEKKTAEFEADFITTLKSVTEKPKIISSTQGRSLSDVGAVRGRALPVTDKDNSNRSTTIIILSSGTACLFIVVSMTIFMISFQRQHGTLDIELQERNCGKDNLDEEDAATFSKLLEMDVSKSLSDLEEKDVCETDECL